MVCYRCFWTRDTTSETYQRGLEVRREVFVREQSVADEVEVADEEQCDHLQLYSVSGGAVQDGCGFEKGIEIGCGMVSSERHDVERLDHRSLVCVGTARLYHPTFFSGPFADVWSSDDVPRTFKVQRVAVLRSYRGRGLGIVLMRDCESRALAYGAQRLVLGAQVYAVPFYERLGYRITTPDVFLDGGIDHLWMEKLLD